MSTSSRRYLRWLTCSLEDLSQKLHLKHSNLWQGEEMSSIRCLLTKGFMPWQVELSIHSGDYWRPVQIWKQWSCSQHWHCLEKALQWVRGARSTRTESHSPYLSSCSAGGDWIILARLILRDKRFICFFRHT